ncbi:MAG: MFS transporter [Acidimicrobiia bacterium]
MGEGSGAKRTVLALESVNFRRYFAGQLLSTLGTWMQITAQIWLVLEITDSGAALGRVSALQFVPALLLGAWAGSIADRFENRRLLLVTNVFAGLFALALGVLSLQGSLTVGWLYVAAFGVGTGNAFDRAAGPAFVTSLVPADHLPSAIGLYSVTTSASRMVGTAVAGVIVATWGPTACFFINAASYLLVLASLLSLRTGEITDRRVHGEPIRVKDGLTHIRARPILRRTLVTTTVVGMFGMNFMILVPAMVRLTFDADANWFGIAEVFSGAGSTAAGFLVGALHRPTARTVALGAMAMGAATICTGLAPTLVAFCVLMFAVGLAAVGFMTVSMTVTQANAEPSMRGRVSALQTVAQSGAMPIGSLLIGGLMSGIGVRTTMVLTGASAVVAGLVLTSLERARPSVLWADGDVGHPPVELDATLEPPAPPVLPDGPGDPVSGAAATPR